MKRKMINNKGFSLTELIIVIAIISILAAAITPMVIKYIDKARRAVDVQTAEVIFDAANLAAASADDEVAAGWSVCTKMDAGVVAANFDGHRAPDSYKFSDTPGYYTMRPVAWGRGVRKDGKGYDGKTRVWENSYMKATSDAENEDARLQRVYVDEFLNNVYHEEAVSGYDKKGHRNYDGENENLLAIKCQKVVAVKSGKYKVMEKSYNGSKRIALWIIYRREDNGMPEIWLGAKDTGKSIEPLYRLFPDPCEEYR